jgi:hypothetical protein
MTLAEALSRIKVDDLDVTLTKQEQKELDEAVEHERKERGNETTIFTSVGL